MLSADDLAQIEAALDARENDNQYNPSPIPYHTHNGTDSPLVDKINAGTGSVTSVSVVTANGVSGSVATATTTPAITLTLGAITPSSVAASGQVTGSNIPTTPSDATKYLNGNGGWTVPTIAVPAEYDAGNCTGTKTLDFNNGWTQYITLTGNCTFTFSNPASGNRYILHIAGAYTPTFPATVRWPGNVTPPATATVGYKDIYTFIYSAKESLYDGLTSIRYAIT